MTSWGTVVKELLALLPIVITWLRERSIDKKAALLEALNTREQGWKDGDASSILNSVRRSGC
jgi:hypothetical protein